MRWILHRLVMLVAVSLTAGVVAHAGPSSIVFAAVAAIAVSAFCAANHAAAALNPRVLTVGGRSRRHSQSLVGRPRPQHPDTAGRPRTRAPAAGPAVG